MSDATTNTVEQEPAELHEVTPRFNLYYHPFWMDRSQNTDPLFWADDKYQNLSVITTIEEFLGIMSLVRTEHMNAGYFYLMREGVYPTWENPSNENGGEWKLRIGLDTGDEPVKAFTELGLRLLSWNITEKEDDAACINGICIAPNTDRQWVLKIWNNNKDMRAVSILSATELAKWRAVDDLGNPSTRYSPFKEARDTQQQQRSSRGGGRMSGSSGLKSWKL